ncbi:uncharacterized protein LOC130565469 [Triplophysa rosa]|uniref:uncharacterized protein LOC130559811 n=1 Tax=Triplophysa rosa TaxID=992332 RepID=UPI0025460BBE|nr:uncharacterized protein LOC130559811 [Triplophysa rosa]XP_057208183.1 uncharacterized protein LOC130565469 [Triplophysa rosa]
MDFRRPKKRFSIEDVLPETTESSEEDMSDLEEEDELSSDEDDGPALFRFGSHSESDEDWEEEASQSPEKRFISSSSATFSTRTTEEKQIRSSPDGCNGTSEEEQVFRPARTPGPQLKSTASYSPLELFQLFLSDSMLETVVANTNAHGIKRQEDTNPWVNISLNDMYSYVAMLLYLGLQRCLSPKDFWRTTKIHHPEFPSNIMAYEKYSSISATLHLSDATVDAENDTKRGTSAYDPFCKIKPMYLELRDACKTHFHPYQNVSINERTVSTNPRTGLEEHMKCKTTKGKNLRHGAKE